MVSLNSWAASDIGRKRLNNEDSYYQDLELGLFMVADGMGGHKGGERASKLAITEAAETYGTKIGDVTPNNALELAFTRAAKRVFQESLTKNELRGMGTTLTALAVHNGTAFIAHIGDTRIYCVRDRTLHQLTSDHSLVNEQVQAGIMSQEEARLSSFRNIITRAIGHDENVKADHFSIAIKQNDIFLLCTDGLNNMLLDSEILDIVLKLSPAKAVKKLIAEANRKGGDDNITVILVEAAL